MLLTETERMIVLMMRGYGDRIRSYREVVELFNATYPDQCDPISKSTVERTIARFQRTLIKDEPRSGRSPKALLTMIKLQMFWKQ